MTGTTARTSERRWRHRRMAWAITGFIVAVFVGANAHLVAVSFASQPDCVLSTTPLTEGAGAYRAAKPSC